jgi:hypothetical protein
MPCRNCVTLVKPFRFMCFWVVTSVKTSWRYWRHLANIKVLCEQSYLRKLNFLVTKGLANEEEGPLAQACWGMWGAGVTFSMLVSDSWCVMSYCTQGQGWQFHVKYFWEQTQTPPSLCAGWLTILWYHLPTQEAVWLRGWTGKWVRGFYYETSVCFILPFGDKVTFNLSR